MVSIRKSVIESSDLFDLSNNNDNGLFFNLPGFICEEYNYTTCFNNGLLKDFSDFVNSIPTYNKLFWIPGLTAREKDILRKYIEDWKSLSSNTDFLDFTGSSAIILNTYLLYLSDLHKCNILEFEIYHEIERSYSYHNVFDKEDKLKNMSDKEFIEFLNKAIMASKLS